MKVMGYRIPIQLKPKIKDAFDQLHEELGKKTQSETMDVLINCYRGVKLSNPVFVNFIEKDLESYVINNLNKIENNLKPYLSFKESRQIKTDSGRIDILAINENDSFVVIEVKTEHIDRTSLTQIITYISWIKRNLSKDNSVKGVIIAPSFDKKVIEDIAILPFIKLIKYSCKTDFSFIEVIN